MPKVIFTYSSIYNRILSQIPKYSEIPDSKLTARYIAKFEKAWRPFESKIFVAIAKTTGFKWHEKEIPCYVTGGYGAFSDPLTVSMRKDTEHCIDTLTHELIHRNISHDEISKINSKKWRAHMKRYSKENRVVAVHVYIHAVHQKVILDLFGQGRFEKERNKMRHNTDYNRAWEIVEEVGYQKIIDSLKS